MDVLLRYSVPAGHPLSSIVRDIQLYSTASTLYTDEPSLLLEGLDKIESISEDQLRPSTAELINRISSFKRQQTEEWKLVVMLGVSGAGQMNIPSSLPDLKQIVFCCLSS